LPPIPPPTFLGISNEEERKGIRKKRTGLGAVTIRKRKSFLRKKKKEMRKGKEKREKEGG